MNPNFDNPPVVERVIGIQFEELPFFTNAHAGWFWKGGYLDDSWSQLTTAPPVGNVREAFGGQQAGGQPPGFKIKHGAPPERSQIVRASDARMIQLQNTRFLLNWRKFQDAKYLSFPDMFAEYLLLLEKFRAFVRDAKGGELGINQWEITYVNDIPKAPLWTEVADWQELFLGLSLPLGNHDSQKMDNASISWSLALPHNIGRLHITLQNAIDPQTGESLIRAELTSRGPATDQASFEKGIDAGHKAIVDTFRDITSEAAHIHWGKK